MKDIGNMQLKHSYIFIFIGVGNELLFLKVTSYFLKVMTPALIALYYSAKVGIKSYIVSLLFVPTAFLNS